MMAAIIVAPADNPILPNKMTLRKIDVLATEKFITAKKRGTVIISSKSNRIKLKISLPMNILTGAHINFSVSDVCFSSSRTNICDKPDMDEKKRIIHNNADLTSLLAPKVPIENETAKRVTIANSNIALTEYRVLNSC
jgi:hypothetical protein